eukprot:4010125-Prymnesium_polylepis.1
MPFCESSSWQGDDGEPSALHGSRTPSPPRGTCAWASPCLVCQAPTQATQPQQRAGQLTSRSAMAAAQPAARVGRRHTVHAVPSGLVSGRNSAGGCTRSAALSSEAPARLRVAPSTGPRDRTTSAPPVALAAAPRVGQRCSGSACKASMSNEG